MLLIAKTAALSSSSSYGWLQAQKQGSGIPFLLPEGQVGPQVQGDAMHVRVPDLGLAQAQASWRGYDKYAVAPLLSSEELLIQNMIDLVHTLRYQLLTIQFTNP